MYFISYLHIGCIIFIYKARFTNSTLILLPSPSHSFILDTFDKCRETTFVKEDLRKIKTYKLQLLPTLPSGMQEYIDSLKSITDLDMLYTTLKQQEFHPSKDPRLEWIQSTLYNSIKLFMFNCFLLIDQSECDMLRRLGYSIDTVFDDLCVNCRR